MQIEYAKNPNDHMIFAGKWNMKSTPI